MGASRCGRCRRGERLRSRPQEHLDRVAPVHRAVGLRGLVERQLEVEHLARVDLAVPDEIDQLGQEAPHRRGSAVHVGEAPEQVHAVHGDAVGDADEADVPAGAGGADRLIHGHLGADGLDHGVGAESVGERLDRGDSLVAARFDDVGGAELAGQPLARSVAAHGDDPLGAEPLGGEHGEQADGDGLARPASAATRMIASVGSTMRGSSRSSTRTSPGPCITAPRMRSPSVRRRVSWLAGGGPIARSR
jgi:hypothetical protein